MRCPEVIRTPWQRATARRMTPSSSWTLPGQSYLVSESEGVSGEADDLLAEFKGETSPERFGETFDIAAAVPERRELADHAEPVVEVLAELAALDEQRQVFARRDDEPDRRGHRPAGFAVVVLKGTEETTLESVREVGDLFQEDRDGSLTRDSGMLPLWGSSARPRSARLFSSCSNSSSVSVAESMRMKGRSGLEPRLWIARASKALPVPGSPRISTGVLVGAIVLASSSAWRMLGSSPTMAMPRANCSVRCGTGEEAAGAGAADPLQGAISRSVRVDSRACVTAARNSVAGNGNFRTVTLPCRSASFARSGWGFWNRRTTGRHRDFRPNVGQEFQRLPIKGINARQH